MNDKTLKTVKIVIAFALAFVFLFSLLYTYKYSFKYIYELTFLSNFVTGIFFAVAGVLWLCNKSVPQYLFLDFAILLLIVFGVSLYADFGFEEGWAFLHAVNPILTLVFYFVFSDQTKVKWQFLFTVLVMPVAYLVFALIFGACKGEAVYFFLDYNEYGAGYTAAYIVGIAVGLTAVSVGLYYLNKLIHRYILKDIA